MFEKLFQPARRFLDYDSYIKIYSSSESIIYILERARSKVPSIPNPLPQPKVRLKVSKDHKSIENSFEVSQALKAISGVHVEEGVHRARWYSYSVARYIEGVNLGVAFLQSLKKDLREEERIEYVEDIAQILEEVHEAGFAHLDVKLNNVLVDHAATSRRLILTDFDISGSAQDTLHTNVFGTFGYLPPETIEDGVYGAFVDIYALGCTLWAFLSGLSPFSSNDDLSEEFLKRVVEEKKQFESQLDWINGPTPHLTEVVRETFDHLLNADRKKRYQTMSEARLALRVLREEMVAYRAKLT